MRRPSIIHRRRERLWFACRSLATAAIVAWTIGVEAQAQDPFLSGNIAAPSAAEQELLGTAPASSLLVDPAVQPAQAIYGAGGGSAPNDLMPTRPVNWIAGPYLRSGVNFVLGEDIFDAAQKTGWGISGGYRQPLGPELGGDRFFFDLGGSYQSTSGRATPVLFDGLQTTTITNTSTNPPTVVSTSFATRNDAFATTLEDVRRGSAHAALGWFWGPGLDDRSADTQLRFASRIGGRVGHARGGYEDERLIFAPPDVVNGNFTTHVEIDEVYYKKTDTYGGLFVGTEAILLQRQTEFGHFQWTVDGEFANDWINIGDIWDGSLGTASVMMGFMLSR
ncbi:MAG: hypothetical protein H0T51_08765 [Pirellulales bacterium]|nr:hypothetical protein [Pirellulales bacterium]